MLLSIIIPTRNRSQMLERCLQSLHDELLPQYFPEILVIDDASTPVEQEKNRQLCDRFDCFYQYSQFRRGAAATRNAGILIAHGIWCMFLDDDIRVCKNWFTILVATIKTVDPVVIGIEGRVIPEGSGVWDSEVSNESGGLYLTCHCAYRRAILSIVNGFDEHFNGRYPSCEDHELAARVLRYGEIVFKPELRVIHSARTVPLSSYLANSWMRMHGQLEAEFYFFKKQKDCYHRFRFKHTFASTLTTLALKHVIVSLRRRPILSLVNNPLQSIILIASCMAEQLFAFAAWPYYYTRLFIVNYYFFSDAIDLDASKTKWEDTTSRTLHDFRLKTATLRSILFSALHLPVYSALPALRQRARAAKRKLPARCFLRIDDVFLNQPAYVEKMCTILHEYSVPFLAGITGNQLINDIYQKSLDTIITHGGEIGLHGFSHTGKYGPYPSEILQMTFTDINNKIDAVLQYLPQNRQPVAFIPPFNAINRDQILQIGQRIPVICTGAETARFTDKLFGPLVCSNGSIFFPSLHPYYNPAKRILRSHAIDKLEAIGGTVCITVHMPDEAKSDFSFLNRLAERISKLTTSWKELLP